MGQNLCANISQTLNCRKTRINQKVLHVQTFLYVDNSLSIKYFFISVSKTGSLSEKWRKNQDGIGKELVIRCKTRKVFHIIHNNEDRTVYNIICAGKST